MVDAVVFAISPTSSLFFSSQAEVNAHPSTTPQACIIIPDLLLLHMVGEEGEGGTARERERANRQRC